LLKKMQKT